MMRHGASTGCCCSNAEDTGPETLDPEFQYVWSVRYIDAPILRDENKDGDGDCIDGQDERLYYTTDANTCPSKPWRRRMNVTALTEADGDIVERYLYDPYGKVTILNGAWSEIEGSVLLRRNPP